MIITVLTTDRLNHRPAGTTRTGSSSSQLSISTLARAMSLRAKSCVLTSSLSRSPICTEPPHSVPASASTWIFCAVRSVASAFRIAGRKGQIEILISSVLIRLCQQSGLRDSPHDQHDRVHARKLRTPTFHRLASLRRL